MNLFQTSDIPTIICFILFYVHTIFHIPCWKRKLIWLLNSLSCCNSCRLELQYLQLGTLQNSLGFLLILKFLSKKIRICLICWNSFLAFRFILILWPLGRTFLITWERISVLSCRCVYCLVHNKLLLDFGFLVYYECLVWGLTTWSR